MIEIGDHPSNLHRCRECTTLFPADVLSCPHCQTEVTVESAVDDTEDAPVTVTRKPRRGSGMTTVELPADAPPLPTDK